MHFNRDGSDRFVWFLVPLNPHRLHHRWKLTGPRTWVGTYLVTPATGNGYQFIRVADALAGSDPWLSGKDVARFRFNIIISGSAAMNLQASGGNGFVDLIRTQTDFDRWQATLPLHQHRRQLSASEHHLAPETCTCDTRCCPGSALLTSSLCQNKYDRK